MHSSVQRITCAEAPKCSEVSNDVLRAVADQAWTGRDEQAIECCGRAAFLAAGVDDCVTKPIRVDSLMRCEARMEAGP